VNSGPFHSYPELHYPSAMSIPTTEHLWVISRLTSNASVFQGLLHLVQEPQAKWRPSPDKWSILEVINHVADEELEDFGTRLRFVLEDSDRAWPPIDPERAAVERQYNSRDLNESLERFIAARLASVEWLQGLQAPDWNTTHTHPGGNQLRAGDLLHSWLVHDLIHIRQINRLHYEYLAALKTGFSSAYAGSW
jgi:hypothetical protein